MAESGESNRAEMLEQALDSSIDGMAILDSDGRYRYVNESHASLYGFEDAEALHGEHWRRLYDEDEIERFEQEILPVLEERGNWRGTATGLKQNGDTFPQELSLTSMPDGGLVCVVRDVTERRERRRVLEHYETVVENIRDGVYTLDTRGQITWVNETAVDEYDIGYSRDELVGSPVSIVLGDEDINKCLSIIQNLVDEDSTESGRCEVELQTAHGTEIPCELHLTLLRDERESVQGTVGVVRDITERKRREQRLSVLNRVLRHNLRNELNVVMGQAEWLAANLDGEFVEKAERIQETAERLTALGEKARTIENTLQHDASHQRSVDLVAAVKRSCEEYGAAYPDATLELDAPDQQSVIADETIETVVDNLVENALEHTGPAPTVRVSISTAGPGDDWVQLRVSDDGPGIPPEEIEILDAEEETQMVHGTGLGLWVVYWLVDSYGGGLSFEETDSGGACAVVSLRAD